MGYLKHNVAVDVEVFGLLVEDGVGGNVKCALTVAVERWRARTINLKISK